jgi:SH3-like domain-containing protein
VKGHGTPPDPAQLAERIEAIRRAHVADPRLAVWDVRVEEEDGRLRVAGWTTVDRAIGEIRDASAASGATAEVAALPDPALGAEVEGVAHRSLAHLRREPRHASELVSQVILGEEVTCLRAQGEWLQVQAGDGYTGWIHRGSLVRRAPAEGLEAFRARLAARRPPEGSWVVTARAPVAREDPAPGSPVVCDLVRGARVHVVGEERGALRVTLPDGVEGWIAQDEAVPWERIAERFPPTGRAILEHAAEHLGLPYLWGGTSEKGYDCSGLVQRVYGLHGVDLPRDSDQQSVVGSAVEPGHDWSGVEDGDLAYFCETPGGRSTHVGILARGGRLLHASTTRNGVAWDALQPAAPGWSEFGARLAARLNGIRRVLR